MSLNEMIPSGLQTRYISVPVSNPLRVRDFLMGMLGFRYSESTTLTNGTEGIVVGATTDSDSFLVLLKNSEADTGQARIMISTSDCLRDYHLLTEAGVRFVTKPEYIPKGLAADLVDADGNRFTLLEERNYSDEL